ncbi:MAG: hypothetical protein O3C54_00320 [Proteobacteria bacterium]|uniref:Uncharacterized protein n=1 Tax=SAR86 cluster bacterium TaxID=2030880 RepID=A0A937IAC6_9GAMM|nr:hypothetical protein [SAR86 cluster bacterium]MDA0344385.1 hypothetical protein [Pseudomonadota bacterium]MDA0899599.1 hypothetical protein [Pseudomonadota bacterium]MDA1056391.1 hypothetical protein [Pseudomonadota bacterium]
MKVTLILSLVVLSMSMASYEIMDIGNKLNTTNLGLRVMDDPEKAENNCPNSSNGCLIRSADGELTIYLKDFASSMDKDISLFGLMFDAYQLNEFGNIDVLKTCRMKLAYAKTNKYRKASDILSQKC